MKKHIICLWALLITLNSYSQTIEPFVSIGYGTYQMDEAKSLFDAIILNSLLDVHTTDYFPAYLNYDLGASYLFENNKVALGFVLSYMSTGARASLADYSGTYTFDYLLNAMGYSFVFSYKLNQLKGIDIYFMPRAGYMSSKLTMEDTLILEDSNSSYDFKFKSGSVIVEPTIEIRKYFNKIGIYLNGGYCLDFKGKLNADDKNIELTLNGDKVNTNWSGLRVKLGVCYRIDSSTLGYSK